MTCHFSFLAGEGVYFANVVRIALKIKFQMILNVHELTRRLTSLQNNLSTRCTFSSMHYISYFLKACRFSLKFALKNISNTKKKLNFIASTCIDSIINTFSFLIISCPLIHQSILIVLISFKLHQYISRELFQNAYH